MSEIMLVPALHGEEHKPCQTHLSEAGASRALRASSITAMASTLGNKIVGMIALALRAMVLVGVVRIKQVE